MRNSLYLCPINTYHFLYCHTSFYLADMTVHIVGRDIALLRETVSLYAQLA
jgi:hypothetical protein